MKRLNLFQQFNFGAWAKDKQFMIQSIRWNDKRNCVTLDVIITEDNTDYGDTDTTNIFEKFKAHLIKETDEDDVEKYNVRDKIVFKNIGKCSVWGDYSSNLSVEAIVEVVEK